jgi:hypothetical protein
LASPSVPAAEATPFTSLLANATIAASRVGYVRGDHKCIPTGTTHFAFRVDIWDDTGDAIVEHVAGADDFLVAEAIYRTATAR